MGSWTALLVAYLLGGVTFIPLLLTAILLHGHWTFPYRLDAGARQASEEDGAIVRPGDDTVALEEAKKKGKESLEESRARFNSDLDVAAGYFAVCREYMPMGINAKPIERSTPVGSTTVASPSPSVYQTMYRSIFERKPLPGPLEGTGVSQRPKKAGNVFYVVLRHGHLMLFDDEEQLEVRHVISLAHYDISIYSGGDVTPEGELYIKRNALCLSRRQTEADRPPDSPASKPFYLFSENCSAKEDFYFALLKNQEQTFGADASAPKPKHFDVKSIISLVQRLHSSEDHLHSRWVNAMLGRIFLAVYETRDLEHYIREKITKKISRVRRPSFLTNVSIQKIVTGEGAPYLTNLRLKDLTVEGECLVEADVRYTGNCQIEVGATVKIDLGARFKAREVHLVLAVVLKRIEGHVLFKIKPPPSNRLWFSFQSMPKMEMAIEPIVSSRQITYTVILRQIENRIKEVFAETLVQPSWDDLPFFRTEHKRWRGGIFEGDDAIRNPSTQAETAPPPGSAAPAGAESEKVAVVTTEAQTPKKSHSTSSIEAQQEKPPGLFGRKLGKNANASTSTSTMASIGMDANKTTECAPRTPNIFRTPPEPIVGTETTHADLFKPSSSPPDRATSYMAALQSRSNETPPPTIPVGSPRRGSIFSRPLSQPPPSTDGEEAAADTRASTTPVPAQARRNTASSSESLSHSGLSGSESSAKSISSSPRDRPEVSGRSFFLRRENSNHTGATESSAADLRKSTLAAVTSAAQQAKQWGWSALQRQKDHRRVGDKSAAQIDLSRPIGRGQPLPPPGMPLPGPSSGRTGIGPSSSPKHRSMPERPPSEIRPGEKEADRVPDAQTRISHRHRKGASLSKEEEESGQKMLVIEAPHDSQPGTPATPGTEEKLPGEGRRVEPGGPAVRNARERQDGEAAFLAELASRMREDPVACEGKGFDAPLVALPAATTPGAPDEDEDDYAGWMDEDAFEYEKGEDELPRRFDPRGVQ